MHDNHQSFFRIIKDHDIPQIVSLQSSSFLEESEHEAFDDGWKLTNHYLTNIIELKSSILSSTIVTMFNKKKLRLKCMEKNFVMYKRIEVKVGILY